MMMIIFLIIEMMALTGTPLFGQSATERMPAWMLPLRDAVYAQNIDTKAGAALYEDAVRGARASLSGAAQNTALARIEYYMGRLYEDAGDKAGAAASYDRGIEFAKQAQAVLGTGAAPGTAAKSQEAAETWVIWAMNLGNNCTVKPTAYMFANGLNVEKYAKNCLAIDAGNIEARYLLASRWAYAPSPFGDYPKGVKMLQEILADEAAMEADQIFNVYGGIAYAYYQQKKYDEADTWAKKALALYPTSKFAKGLLKK
jgi:tetratricopeptide (TPR) repeat protein